MRAGIVYRQDLAAWLATRPSEVRCLELSVDEAFVQAGTTGGTRVGPCPTALHATKLSLGSTRPLDPAALDNVARAVRAVDPIWVAAHLGCRYRPEVELSYPQPVTLDRASLGRVVANCRQLIDACGRPVLVENVAAFGSADGPLGHAQFINHLCSEVGCGLLVDVSAFALDARLGFEPRRWLWDVDPFNITALHVGSWERRGVGDWSGCREFDLSHDAWMLARDLAERTPVGTALLRRDGPAPRIPEIQTELRRLASLDRAAIPAFGRAEPAVAKPL